MKRICSRRSNLIVNINRLKDWFRERGYPEEIVNKETKRALESSISSSNNKSKKNTQGDRQKGIPLVVTYNPFLCHLGQTIRKNIFLLYQVEEVKRVFTPAPFVSFCTARTLRTHLVRAKVYPAEERLVGSRNLLDTVVKSVKTLRKQALSKVLWTKRFTRLVTDLHVVINV